MGALLALTTLVALTITLAGPDVSCQHTPAVDQPQPAYAVSDLPRNPELQCAATEVEDAVLACEGWQDITQCCSGLDAVYSNRSSTAFGCLCLPVVLYETAKQASEYDVDVFGVLRQCRQQYPDFQTQWAAATPTACPTMLLQGDLIDRLARMGSAPILSSDGAPTWAWSNLLQAQQFAELHPAGSQAMTDLADYILGRWLPVCMILSLLCATLLFFAVHKCVLMRISTVYKAMPMEQQLVTCQHAVYVAAYGLTIIPQTWLAAELLFKVWTGNDLQKRTITTLIAFATGRALLFTVEACVRSVKWSWLLFLHHALNIMTTTVNMWDGSPVLAIIGTVLDLFTAHELPLYVVLVAYRLGFWPRRVTRVVLRCACTWFAATRVLQTAMLAYMFRSFLTVPSIRSTPAFVITAALCGAFTFLQTYTLFIYRSMDRKLGSREASLSSTGRRACDAGSPQEAAGVRARKQLQLPSCADDRDAKDQGAVLSEPLLVWEPCAKQAK